MALPEPVPVLAPLGVPLTTTHRVISYTYDSLYRLITTTYSSGEYYHYTYDAVGNRQSLTTHQDVVNYQYDAANRLTSVNGQAYTWDDNGNLLNDGTRSYSYDHANRLVQVVSGTLTTEFAYNGVGDRVARTLDGVTTDYVLDPAAGLTQVLQETTGGQATSYLYGHDLLAQYDSGTWAYHLNDGLGSVRQLVDPAGQVVASYSFSPFGVPLGESGGEPYGFTGEQWDASAELVFLRARYMQPTTGRFITQDPWPGDLLRPQSLNPYLYVTNNSVNRLDPTGLFSNATIAASFGVHTFEEVMELFKGTMPELEGRWGLLKLLQDAKPHDTLELGTAILAFSGNHGIVKYEAFRFYCVDGEIKLLGTRPNVGAGFLPTLPLRRLPDHLSSQHMLGRWWRDQSARIYYLDGREYIDDSSGAELPDFYAATFSLDIYAPTGWAGIGLGGSVTYIVDRYGGTYLSVGGGPGGGLFPVQVGYYEGYVNYWNKNARVDRVTLENSIERWDIGVGGTIFASVSASVNIDKTAFEFWTGTAGLILGVAGSAEVSHTWRLPSEKPDWAWNSIIEGGYGLGDIDLQNDEPDSCGC